MDTLSLSHLTTFIRRVFALNLPEPVWISAELAQVSASRGNLWLTLVEKGADGGDIVAQLDAVIWSSSLQQIRKLHGQRLVDGLLQEGMSVRLRVTTSFHERFGLKLVIEDVDPAYTIGTLERKRQDTLEHLHRDGILDRNVSLPLPPIPRRLAVVSSETAAGLSDFLRQLEENPYGYRFTTELFPAAMQGNQTTEEIAKRLRQIGRRKEDFDLIVIVRGGGGKTDLAAFDDELLCRTVAGAALPVVSGIGHEIDTTVLDRVVHRSLKTPTAVAAFLIQQFLSEEAVLLQLGRRISSKVAGKIRQEASARDHQSLLIDRLATTAIRGALQQVDNQENLVNALRPEATLSRGYALVSQRGKIITRPGELSAGDVELRLREGKVTLQKS